VEKLDVPDMGTVELNEVLMIVADDNQITVGKPTVTGAKVIATAVASGKAEKVIAYKFKSKVRYHRNVGHRQLYTRLSIDQIVTEDGPVAAEAPPKTTQRKKEAIPEATLETAEAPKKTIRRKKEVKEDGA
jgi:large subunit ribosomal protein L21